MNIQKSLPLNQFAMKESLIFQLGKGKLTVR